MQFDASLKCTKKDVIGGTAGADAIAYMRTADRVGRALPGVLDTAGAYQPLRLNSAALHPLLTKVSWGSDKVLRIEKGDPEVAPFSLSA